MSNEWEWEYFVDNEFSYDGKSYYDDDPHDDPETHWDELEDELHAKADRRAKKKEMMPMDGRGLVVNNVNRKFKREKKNDSIF